MNHCATSILIFFSIRHVRKTLTQNFIVKQFTLDIFIFRWYFLGADLNILRYLNIAER